MTIGDKIKNLRNGKKMSQAELADRLGVSRQAVTKWETDGGTPEIESLVAIADTFGTSVDALIKDDLPCFSSIIQYDIETKKDFEIDLIPSSKVVLEGHDSEKVRVEMLSNTITTLDSDLKVFIEDKKHNMGIEMKRRNDLTDTDCMNDLFIRIRLPRDLIGGIELKTETKELHLRDFMTEDVEVRGKADAITLQGVHGQAEMDIGDDCVFTAYDLDGSLEINQIGKSSVVKVPKDLRFKAVNDGRKCELTVSEMLSPDDSCEDFIELNGMKSKLTIEPLK